MVYGQINRERDEQDVTGKSGGTVFKFIGTALVAPTSSAAEVLTMLRLKQGS